MENQKSYKDYQVSSSSILELSDLFLRQEMPGPDHSSLSHSTNPASQTDQEGFELPEWTSNFDLYMTE